MMADDALRELLLDILRMQSGMAIDLGLVKSDVDSLLSTLALLDAQVIPAFWDRRLCWEEGEMRDRRARLWKLDRLFEQLNGLKRKDQQRQERFSRESG
jgi:hypothetical protein